MADKPGISMARCVAIISSMLMLLTGCIKVQDARASTAQEAVSVNVHGINYSAEPFTYVIADEQNPSNRAGGEHVSPYRGGGVMCCFALPKQWKPGLRVKVQTTYWLREDSKGNLPEVHKAYILEVPRYASGGVGELWVLRTAAGGIDLVVSDVEPSHAEWPGKIKGWPKPSLDFQREQWELRREQAEMYVSTYQDELNGLKSRGKSGLSDEWEFDKKYNEEDIKKFTGPNDTRYAEYKRQSYSEGLKRAKARLEQILKSKP